MVLLSGYTIILLSVVLLAIPLVLYMVLLAYDLPSIWYTYSGYTVILLYGILTLTLSFCMVLWLYHNPSIWYSDYTLAFYVLQSTWCSGYTVGARVVPLESYPLSQLFKPVCFPLGVTKFTFIKSPPPFIYLSPPPLYLPKSPPLLFFTHLDSGHHSNGIRF